MRGGGKGGATRNYTTGSHAAHTDGGESGEDGADVVHDAGGALRRRCRGERLFRSEAATR